MTVVFKLDEQGGFTAGDTVTRVTVYAYPTSPIAQRAKRDPAKVAAARLARENAYSFRGSPVIVAEHDARNWSKLEG